MLIIIEREYSKKWILENPLLFIESLFEFMRRYQYRDISVSDTDNFFTIHASIEEN